VPVNSYGVFNGYLWQRLGDCGVTAILLFTAAILITLASEFGGCVDDCV
jgi:hypothetical protein